MNEKPKASYAEEFLGVKGKDGVKKYMSVFGQYIITPEVFAQLHLDIQDADDPNKEIELTSALEKVREQYGMIGVQLQGRMYDMGNYHALVNCVSEFSK
jgi:UTP-glucose-1-phosphate uridylyltransferase